MSIRRSKNPQAFLRSKARTFHSYLVRFVIKALYFRDSGESIHWLYPLHKSHRLMYLQPLRRSKMYCTNGIGKFSGIVIAFILLKSITTLFEPSFLGTTRQGLEYGLFETLIIPLFNSFSTLLSMTSSSCMLRLYCGTWTIMSEFKCILSGKIVQIFKSSYVRAKPYLIFSLSNLTFLSSSLVNSSSGFIPLNGFAFHSVWMSIFSSLLKHFRDHTWKEVHCRLVRMFHF